MPCLQALYRKLEIPSDPIEKWISGEYCLDNTCPNSGWAQKPARIESNSWESEAKQYISNKVLSSLPVRL